MGIELAHRVESLAQGVLPLDHEAGLFGEVVEDRHPRAPGEAHQLDLDTVLLLDALGAVHHHDDSGPRRHRLQQLAVVGEQGIVAMGLDELLGQVADLGVGLEPFQDGARVLEAGGVDELDHRLPVDDDRVEVRLGGGARALVDGDAVVLGQGGDHGGLARVGVAHDRQSGDLKPIDLAYPAITRLRPRWAVPAFPGAGRGRLARRSCVASR